MMNSVRVDGFFDIVFIPQIQNHDRGDCRCYFGSASGTDD